MISLVTFRAAEPADLPAVVALHRQTCAGSQDGQGAVDPLARGRIAEMIGVGDVVVAAIGQAMLGYAWVDSAHRSGAVDVQRCAVERLVAADQIPQGEYAYLAEVAVDPDCTRYGLGSRLLAALRRQVSGRFDYCVGFIDRRNREVLEGAASVGWRVITGVPGGYLALADALPRPASKAATFRRAAGAVL